MAVSKSVFICVKTKFSDNGQRRGEKRIRYACITEIVKASLFVKGSTLKCNTDD